MSNIGINVFSISFFKPCSYRYKLRVFETNISHSPAYFVLILFLVKYHLFVVITEISRFLLLDVEYVMYKFVVKDP